MRFGMLVLQIVIISIVLLSNPLSRPAFTAEIDQSQVIDPQTRKVTFNIVSRKDEPLNLRCSIKLYNSDYTWKNFSLIGKEEPIVLAKYDQDVQLYPGQSYEKAVTMTVGHLPAGKATESDINCR